MTLAAKFSDGTDAFFDSLGEPRPGRIRRVLARGLAGVFASFAFAQAIHERPYDPTDYVEIIEPKYFTQIDLYGKQYVPFLDCGVPRENEKDFFLVDPYVNGVFDGGDHNNLFILEAFVKVTRNIDGSGTKNPNLVGACLYRDKHSDIEFWSDAFDTDYTGTKIENIIEPVISHRNFDI